MNIAAQDTAENGNEYWERAGTGNAAGNGNHKAATRWDDGTPGNGSRRSAETVTRRDALGWNA